MIRVGGSLYALNIEIRGAYKPIVNDKMVNKGTKEGFTWGQTMKNQPTINLQPSQLHI